MLECREDVPAGTARKGEGIGTRPHINTRHGQQLGPSLRGPGPPPAWPRRCTSGHCKDTRKHWAQIITSTLNTINNLGLLYADQGKLDEAEKMYQRALEGYEKALGPDHTSTLNTINNLGLLYADQGKLDEAEKMYQRALQGYEKALGPDHTSTLHGQQLGPSLHRPGQAGRGREDVPAGTARKEKAWGQTTHQH